MKDRIPAGARLTSIRTMTRLVMILAAIFVGGSTFLAVNNYNTARVEKQAAFDLAEQQRLEVENWDKIEDGIHLRTGLKDGEGLMTVISSCTPCHSAKLLTQNRMSAERWAETIKWMQDEQGLWDLGENQEVIINYLVTNYPYVKKGRRLRLENIEWYELE